MHEPTPDRPALMQGLLQGIKHKAGVSAPRDPPGDDAPSKGVDYEGHVHEARPGRDVGEVADPKRVRPQHPELPVNAVERARRDPAADRGAYRRRARPLAGPWSASGAPPCSGPR